ncbi:LL-diaminopimelate aminotransferase [Ruminococcaceae bacterium OttesenSCG-928-I18]|nr:LL-diaminopimelate aminotransferase [Ruminococcaceae bacterium OttesenSCG-928-I18]
MQLNPNFANLSQSYLFTDIARRVAAYKEEHPNADIIRLGIGDVTRPLAKPVADALCAAGAEMADAATFMGYGPEHGYPFLREAIANYYKTKHGVTLSPDEIFVSDGAKSDCGNILELFTADNTALIPDPVYPAYVDANVMDGRRIEYVSGTRENGFLPAPPEGQKADIIYLCSPNNPTGAAYTKKQLAAWIRYAYSSGAVILFDAAYECFVSDKDVPHSVYEVEGAKECVVEICSLSKTAGFTGLRCGYTVVPKGLRPAGEDLRGMWSRRQQAKFNEVPYVVQRAAEAVFTPEGLKASFENVDYYKKNAAVIAKALDKAGVWYSGGVNSPYLWLACPGNLTSWDFFDKLLAEAGVVGTPGSGFGKNGEGYFRLTGFGDAARTEEAAQRLTAFLKKL